MARDVTVHFTDDEEALIIGEAQAAGITDGAEILVYVQELMKNSVRIEVLDRFLRREQTASAATFEAAWPP